MLYSSTVPCVIQLTGDKDVGKTVLAEAVIREAVSRGLTVNAVKAGHHPPDPSDKDSARLREAGSELVLYVGGGVYAVYSRTPPPVEYLTAVDLIVVEGFRDGKVGFKVHIGPNPPTDADMVIGPPVEQRASEVLDEALRRCVADLDELRRLIVRHGRNI